MGSFKFANRIIHVEIEGENFSFTYDTKLGDAVKAFSAKCDELTAEVACGKKGDGDILLLCEDVINTVLGKDAFLSVFKDRAPSVSDSADLINFLAAEITKHAQKLNGNGNRSQRRAQK